MNVGEALLRAYRAYLKGFVVCSAKTDSVENGNAWLISHDFVMDSGTTAYLIFRSTGRHIHATNRRVNVVDLGIRLINVKITTLKSPTIGTLGNDISSKIINANFNYADNIDLEMFDETSTVTNDGPEAPFSGTITADRRQAAAEFISDQYILEVDSYLALKFENLGQGQVRVEYNSNGYQHE